jgi:hypothetical protein
MSMNVNHAPAASRQFVAEPPFWGSKMASRTTPGWQTNPGKSYGVMVAVCFGIAIVLGVLFVGMQAVLPPDVAETVGRSIRQCANVASPVDVNLSGATRSE